VWDGDMGFGARRADWRLPVGNGSGNRDSNSAISGVQKQFKRLFAFYSGGIVVWHMINFLFMLNRLEQMKRTMVSDSLSRFVPPQFHQHSSEFRNSD
jgi:hypothetical protein